MRIFAVFITLLTLAITQAFGSCDASPMPTNPVIVHDKSGNSLPVRFHGDEFLNWVTLSSDAAPFLAFDESRSGWFFAVSWDFVANRAVAGPVPASLTTPIPDNTLFFLPDKAVDIGLRRQEKWRRGEAWQ